MVDAKWCSVNLNSSDNIDFSTVTSEIKELIDAKNLDEVKEEIGDVLYFTYCWIYSKFRINLPMLGAMASVRKFINRLVVWERIFSSNGLKFDTKYLVNGSNYNRSRKVVLALELAKKDQRGGEDVVKDDHV